MNNTCLNCNSRHIGCNSICDSYINFSTETEHLRQERHSVIVNKGIIIDSIRRTGKKKGNKVII